MIKKFFLLITNFILVIILFFSSGPPSIFLPANEPQITSYEIIDNDN